MLELLLVVALCVGAWRAFQLRRYWELSGVGGALYLTAADTLNVTESSFTDLHPLHVFIIAFLGPSMWHRRGPGLVPLPPGFDGPLVVRALRVFLSALVVWHGQRAVAARPLLSESDLISRMTTPVVGALVLDLVEGVLAIAATVSSTESP